MNEQNYHKRIRRSKLTVVIITIAIIVGCALATVAVLLYKQVQDLRNNPDKVVVEKANQLKDKVSKIMQLPDETPTIAEVKTEDLDKLKTQEFFRDIKNGDKILIFSKSQKAVIYREDENRIINSGPIVINTSGQ
jgi:predicted PurR-regulated permease PerM